MNQNSDFFRLDPDLAGRGTVIAMLLELSQKASQHATKWRRCVDDSRETRRQRVDHLISVLKRIVKLDVSHYNAILKVGRCPAL
jgi:hypothetical protein